LGVGAGCAGGGSFEHSIVPIGGGGAHVILAKVLNYRTQKQQKGL